MGHHAQYRKRGTDSASLPYPQSPPLPGDWTTLVVGGTISHKFTTAPTAPAEMMWFRLLRLDGSEITNFVNPAINTFFPFDGAYSPGDYKVSAAWFRVTAPPGQTSGWSLTKTVTVI